MGCFPFGFQSIFQLCWGSRPLGHFLSGSLSLNSAPRAARLSDRTEPVSSPHSPCPHQRSPPAQCEKANHSSRSSVPTRQPLSSLLGNAGAELFTNCPYTRMGLLAPCSTNRHRKESSNQAKAKPKPAAKKRPAAAPADKNKKKTKMEKMSDDVFEDSDLDSAKDWIGDVNAWDPRARH